MPPDIEPHVTQLVQMGFQLASRVDPQRLVHAPHPLRTPIYSHFAIAFAFAASRARRRAERLAAALSLVRATQTVRCRAADVLDRVLVWLRS
jgi:hypothetical protein